MEHEGVGTLRDALSSAEIGILEHAVVTELGQLLDRPVVEVHADDLNQLRRTLMVLQLVRGFDEAYELNEVGRETERLSAKLAPWCWNKDV